MVLGFFLIWFLVVLFLVWLWGFLVGFFLCFGFLGVFCLIVCVCMFLFYVRGFFVVFWQAGYFHSQTMLPGLCL